MKSAKRKTKRSPHISRAVESAKSVKLKQCTESIPPQKDELCTMVDCKVVVKNLNHWANVTLCFNLLLPCSRDIYYSTDEKGKETSTQIKKLRGLIKHRSKHIDCTDDIECIGWLQIHSQKFKDKTLVETARNSRNDMFHLNYGRLKDPLYGDKLLSDITNYIAIMEEDIMKSNRIGKYTLEILEEVKEKWDIIMPNSILSLWMQKATTESITEKTDLPVQIQEIITQYEDALQSLNTDMICIHTKTNITKEEKAQELQNTINCKKEMFVKLVKQTEILCEQINQNESYLKCIKQEPANKDNQIDIHLLSSRVKDLDIPSLVFSSSDTNFSNDNPVQQVSVCELELDEKYKNAIDEMNDIRQLQEQVANYEKSEKSLYAQLHKMKRELDMRDDRIRDLVKQMSEKEQTLSGQNLHSLNFPCSSGITNFPADDNHDQQCEENGETLLLQPPVFIPEADIAKTSLPHLSRTCDIHPNYESETTT
ncbi:uncharacterized protein LOC127869409 isoform X2 [Dreissena polymorpha]|uniref:uncharacterized protein LOC127869409 isoform X2 n=1 Tax=Dreissena polymorpha TaxID=45954 RepID=UPI002264832D|nr:uncharacterized protein LOC127869409 isoform X2 [Dreissena polymorpha]